MQDVGQREIVVERRPDQGQRGYGSGDERSHAGAARGFAQARSRRMAPDQRHNSRNKTVQSKHQR